MSSQIGPMLEVRHGNLVRHYNLNLPFFNIGSARDSQILLDDPTILPRLARIERIQGSFVFNYLGSSLSVVLNGSAVQPGKTYKLKDNDVIVIGQYTLSMHSHIQGGHASDLNIQKRTVSLGRAPDSDISLPHLTVSKKHAVLLWNEKAQKHLIQDIQSTNGTFVNGQRVIRPLLLHTGDIIQIGPNRLIYKLDSISKIDQSSNLGLEAIKLNRVVKRNREGKAVKNLIHDISFLAQPKQFIGIVGPSGAGKSTLLHALSGFHPATEGTVTVNGDDLYSNFAAYRNQIGFVPQSNIIHMELTVYEALSYSARLRLPSDTSQEDRENRIKDVLNTLGISRNKNQSIAKLSGGEQKRVSMGVELLTQPGLFFLDEATSGLDPGTESKIMALLRTLAEKGHTIFLVTHATKNIDKCHSVIVLTKYGYLAYFGNPHDALGYFNVQEFDQIYDCIEANDPSEAEKIQQRFLNSRYYKKGAVAQAQKILMGQKSSKPKRTNPTPSNKSISWLRQFIILSKRNLNIVYRDKMSLCLMLLTAPAIGSLDLFFWRQGLFSADGGNARFVITNLFMAAMICCLVGALSSMRDIVKEAEIYRRERMVAINLVPYVLSKIWVCALVSLFSAAIFLLFMELAGKWPDNITIALPVYITMALSVFSGAIMGLCVSAISRNPNLTPLLLLFVLVPQLLFGGIIPSGQLNAGRMGPVGEAISYTTTTKWTFESLVKISAMGDCIVNDYGWSLPEASRNVLTAAQKNSKCNCMGINIFSKCAFPGIRGYKVAEVDQPEPMKPSGPGDPPHSPGNPPAKPVNITITSSSIVLDQWMKEMDKYNEKVKIYQGEMSSYDVKVRKYQDDINQWQSKYQEWKERSGKAIGEAEGIIKSIYDDYGNAFKADLISRWAVLGGIILIFIFALIGILRFKENT